MTRYDMETSANSTDCIITILVFYSCYWESRKIYKSTNIQEIREILEKCRGKREVKHREFKKVLEVICHSVSALSRHRHIRGAKLAYLNWWHQLKGLIVTLTGLWTIVGVWAAVMGFWMYLALAISMPKFTAIMMYGIIVALACFDALAMDLATRRHLANLMVDAKPRVWEIDKILGEYLRLLKSSSTETKS